MYNVSIQSTTTLDVLSNNCICNVVSLTSSSPVPGKNSTLVPSTTDTKTNPPTTAAPQVLRTLSPTTSPYPTWTPQPTYNKKSSCNLNCTINDNDRTSASFVLYGMAFNCYETIRDQSKLAADLCAAIYQPIHTSCGCIDVPTTLAPSSIPTSDPPTQAPTRTRQQPTTTRRPTSPDKNKSKSPTIIVVNDPNSDGDGDVTFASGSTTKHMDRRWIILLQSSCMLFLLVLSI